MPDVIGTFNEYFARWGIRLPAAAIAERRDGSLSACGWSVRWRWRDPPGTLEFYAFHRMTNDRWERISPEGALTHRELWDDIGFSDSEENSRRTREVEEEGMTPRGPTETELRALGDHAFERDALVWALDDEAWQYSALPPSTA